MKLRIALGISLLLNLLVLAFVAKVWLKPDMAASSWLDASIARRESFFQRHPVQASDIVFLGDSITQGGEWDELFPDAFTKNRGIGGDITTGVLGRLQQVTEGRPRAVFIKIGTNDLTHGPVERQTSYAQYRTIVELIQRESPGTEIYLQSILPRAAKYREEVEAFNSQIKAIADERSVTYIDLYPHFLADDGSIDDAYSNDELHLNGQGYDLWAEQLLPYVQHAKGE